MGNKELMHLFVDLQTLYEIFISDEERKASFVYRHVSSCAKKFAKII